MCLLFWDAFKLQDQPENCHPPGGGFEWNDVLSSAFGVIFSELQ